MDLLPFLHFFCFLLYTYLAVLVITRNPGSGLKRVCAVLIGCFALWSLGAIFIHNSATSKQSVILIENLISVCWVSFSSFFLWFALLFSRKKKILRSPLFYVGIFLPVPVFVYMQWNNFLVVDYLKRSFGWATVWSASIWPYIFYCYVVSFLGVGLYVIYRFWRQSAERTKRNQAKIIFWTTLTVIPLGFLTNVILSRFDIHEVPDIANVPAIIWALGLAYIMGKYKFLTITPSSAAENIISTMSDSLILLDTTGNIVKVNPVTLALLGYKEKELKGRPFASLVKENHPNKKLLQRMLGGEDIVNHEVYFITKQGEETPAVFSSSVLRNEGGAIIGIICIGRDVSDWRRMEEELKNLEEKFKILFESAADGYYLNDLEGNFIDGNRAAEQIVGYKREAFVGKNLLKLKLLPAEQIPRGADILARNVRGEATGPDEFTLNRRDGKQVVVEISTFPVKMENRTVVLGMIRNITQRKEAEKILNEYKDHLEEQVNERALRLEEMNERLQAEINERKAAEETLRTSKEKYQTLTENINVGIYRSTPDPAGEFLEANPAAINMFGYEDKESFLTIRAPRVFQKPEDWKRLIRKMLRSGFVKDEELQLKRKDGTPFTAAISAVAVRDEQGKTKYYDGIVEDITGRKRLETQLLQSQKLEAVGRLSGGIAHDFNNLLTSIIGYAELSQLELDPGNPIFEYLNQILETASHTKDLIQQLLAFSRKAVVQPKIINLNKILTNSKKMLQRVLGEDILLEFIPEKRLGNVKADPGQIEQITMNLALNSRDAMPSGGKLTLKTENVEVGKEIVGQYPYMKPGSYVLLSLTDSGCGMTREELSHLFEPFFTTKKKSHGTGLGLSTVYGIVKQNSGYINVHSKLHRGTMVEIYLPRTDEPTKRVESKPITSRLLPGQETILVVEDEEAVRETTAMILSECGYQVIAARSGEEALDLWEQNDSRIDLLLTDVVLPTISGLELSQRLQALKPDLKVIYTSGYSGDVISQHGIVEKDIVFIPKPFSTATLTQTIREVFDT
jgi:two-component system cell cycle sensor histidine kinase/response regulator CckA